MSPYDRWKLATPEEDDDTARSEAREERELEIADRAQDREDDHE